MNNTVVSTQICNDIDQPYFESVHISVEDNVMSEKLHTHYIDKCDMRVYDSDINVEDEAIKYLVDMLKLNTYSTSIDEERNMIAQRTRKECANFVVLNTSWKQTNTLEVSIPTDMVVMYNDNVPVDEILIGYKNFETNTHGPIYSVAVDETVFIIPYPTVNNSLGNLQDYVSRFKLETLRSLAAA